MSSYAIRTTTMSAIPRAVRKTTLGELSKSMRAPIRSSGASAPHRAASSSGIAPKVARLPADDDGKGVFVSRIPVRVHSRVPAPAPKASGLKESRGGAADIRGIARPTPLLAKVKVGGRPGAGPVRGTSTITPSLALPPRAAKAPVSRPTPRSTSKSASLPSATAVRLASAMSTGSVSPRRAFGEKPRLPCGKKASCPKSILKKANDVSIPKEKKKKNVRFAARLNRIRTYDRSVGEGWRLHEPEAPLYEGEIPSADWKRQREWNVKNDEYCLVQSEAYLEAMETGIFDPGAQRNIQLLDYAMRRTMYQLANRFLPLTDERMGILKTTDSDFPPAFKSVGFSDHIEIHTFPVEMSETWYLYDPIAANEADVDDAQWREKIAWNHENQDSVREQARMLLYKMEHENYDPDQKSCLKGSNGQSSLPPLDRPLRFATRMEVQFFDCFPGEKADTDDPDYPLFDGEIGWSEWQEQLDWNVIHDDFCRMEADRVLGRPSNKEFGHDIDGDTLSTPPASTSPTPKNRNMDSEHRSRHRQ
ncbi:hypothetical protein QFC19_000426 [Naganishia cerealis]|uniref:Uncharacterized protein n=2 Tax=Naganishia cerealis TaxID=610337 RepID=A0ACC2WPW4_9TREE|nr:hypothetical protein QFC19_000422 [Naganishia cerealis]KAJ9112871.1 hypothetical protein QFC19_000426 [Naganishia cerealis]